MIPVMKKKIQNINFGERLRSLRKQKGLTLEHLGKLAGVSWRVIYYYEKETIHPPAHLLIPIAKALKVSVDELLGTVFLKEELNPENAALWRRLKKAEILPPRDKKTLLDLLSALIAKSQNRSHNQAQSKNGTN